jgi:hypothetical protein
MNAEVRSVNTNTNTNTAFITQLPASHALKKGAYYAGMKTVNSLPPDLKCLMNEKARFKVAL